MKFSQHASADNKRAATAGTALFCEHLFQAHWPQMLCRKLARSGQWAVALAAAWWGPTTQQAAGNLGSLAVMGVVLQVEVAPQDVELHPVQQVQEGHHPGSGQGPREGQGLDALPHIQLGLPAEAASPAGTGSMIRQQQHE